MSRKRLMRFKEEPMPLIIPEGLPAKEILEKEQIFIMNPKRAQHQDIRPLEILILNLMPKKEIAETQLLRMLSNTALQVNVTLISTDSYQSSHTSEEHLNRFYKSFEDVKHRKFDGFIITGAPVETLQYEEVTYWEEFKKILDYAKNNVYSTVFICWASQAALYHYYNIPKYDSEKKIFGVFDYELMYKDPLTKGFDDFFKMPQSRHTYNKLEDFQKNEDLKVIAHRDETGVILAKSADDRLIFCQGHWEYDRESLYDEYVRDIKKGMEMDLPHNYFKKASDINRQVNSDQEHLDRIKKDINFSWNSHANLFFANWLNYCVYQQTPYDIEQIVKKR